MIILAVALIEIMIIKFKMRERIKEKYAHGQFR